MTPVLSHAAGRGDTEAFAILVRRHQKRMINIAYRMVGDYDEACDVVQESFLCAYRAIGKFRGDARFATWLYGIVLNQARSDLRQRAARSRREGASLDDPVQSDDGSLLGGHPLLRRNRQSRGSRRENGTRRFRNASAPSKASSERFSFSGTSRDSLMKRSV